MKVKSERIKGKSTGMLVLTRSVTAHKQNDIVIDANGSKIIVRLLQVAGKQIRLGFFSLDGTKHQIDRREILRPEQGGYDAEDISNGI